MQLHKLLGFKELQEFATLLKSYRDKMPVEEFMSKLQVLYGAQRAFLIPGQVNACLHSKLSEHGLASLVFTRSCTAYMYMADLR